MLLTLPGLLAKLTHDMLNDLWRIALVFEAKREVGIAVINGYV